jgi:hypothetical protein
MVTKHAQDNWTKHSHNLTTAQKKAVLTLAAKAEKSSDSVAIVAKIAPCDNAHRDNWAMNDRFVIIVRNTVIKTVMLSRAAQINKGHLRTTKIWTIA